MSKAERALRSHVVSISEELKEKNSKRFKDVEARLMKISKAKDKQIQEEITRQTESMSLTVAKQIELDKEKRAYLRLREQEY